MITAFLTRDETSTGSDSHQSNKIQQIKGGGGKPNNNTNAALSVKNRQC